MKIVILDANTLGEDLDLSSFTAAGDVVIYQSTSPEEIASKIKDAEVVVTNKCRLNESNLKDAKSLKLITIAATGFDNIDIEYCKKESIAVTNVAAYSTESVAQVTLSTVLYLLNHMKSYTDFVHGGDYTRSNCFNRLTPVYHELNGMTWGIVGLGNIGKRVASVASAFGCKVICYTRTPKVGYQCVDLNTLLNESDIISLHTPLNEGTRNLISKRELTLMKDGCILVNEARGAVVNESDVADAVLLDKIYFGCDVYSKEPFGENHPYSKILSKDNICLTPHMAWGSFESRVRCRDEMIKNILAFQRGEKRNRIV